MAVQCEVYVGYRDAKNLHQYYHTDCYCCRCYLNLSFFQNEIVLNTAMGITDVTFCQA
jgi:hypothetical protein